MVRSEYIYLCGQIFCIIFYLIESRAKAGLRSHSPYNPLRRIWNAGSSDRDTYLYHDLLRPFFALNRAQTPIGEARKHANPRRDVSAALAHLPPRSKTVRAETSTPGRCRKEPFGSETAK